MTRSDDPFKYRQNNRTLTTCNVSFRAMTAKCLLFPSGTTETTFRNSWRSSYGFSGVSSRWNRIDASTFDLGKIDQKIQTSIKKKEKSFRQKYHREMGRLPDFLDLKKYLMSGAVETLSGALGHGAALAYPNRPYLRWQFNDEHPKRRPSGLRDNPATFLDACKKLHDMFHRLGKQYSDKRQDNGQPFKNIKQSRKFSQSLHLVKRENLLGSRQPKTANYSSRMRTSFPIKVLRGQKDLMP